MRNRKSAIPSYRHAMPRRGMMCRSSPSGAQSNRRASAWSVQPPGPMKLKRSIGYSDGKWHRTRQKASHQDAAMLRWRQSGIAESPRKTLRFSRIMSDARLLFAHDVGKFSSETDARRRVAGKHEEYRSSSHCLGIRDMVRRRILDSGLQHRRLADSDCGSDSLLRREMGRSF